MAHIKSGETRAQATPVEWLKVGRDVGYLANKWSHRDDLVAYVGPGAGGSAPACYNPQTAEVEVNVEVAFGNGITPDHIGDITLRKTQYEFPMATGAIMHEAFHARFSQWSMPDAYKELKRDEYEALMLLEEGRIEYQGLLRDSKAKPFLRSCAMELAIGDAKEAFTNEQPTIAITNLIGLVHARVEAGILSLREVAEIDEWVKSQIGEDNLNAFRELARMAQRHDKHSDATELYPIAKDWAELARKIGKERGETPNENPEGGCGIPAPKGMPMPKELADAIIETLKEIAENIEMSNFDELADQEQLEDWKDEAQTKASEAQEQAENKEVANKVFDKSTGVGVGKSNSRLVEQREPNSLERSASVRISQLLEKAKYRERDVKEIASATPPGRLRTKAIMQNKALRSMGVMKNENPFRKTVRKHTDEPTLTVGVMVDISGSMGSAMNPMATTAWVMSEAVNRIQGKCAMVYYGNDVFPTLSVGQKLPQVKVFTASDGTEKFTKAFKALDGTLGLLYGNGARLLVIVSDGEYTPEETKSCMEIVKKCEKAGVAILWLPFDNGHTANKLGQGYAEVVRDISNPAEASEIIGMSAMRVLNKVGQRAVA